MAILLTFDLETENHTFNKRRASPFDPRNYIVQVGWSVNGGKPQEKYYTEHHRNPVMPVETLRKMGKGDWFIGFNIKFDMLWVWNEPEVQAALKRGAMVYCGQYAEYLLGGMTQDVQMCAMNDIATYYGGGCKLDAVKEMWEEGYLTSEVPRDILTDYLVGDGKEIVGDVMNTWLIYRGQIKRMKTEMAPEFIQMFKHRMDGLCFSTEAEFNGVYVCKETGDALQKDLAEELVEASEKLEEFIPELPEGMTFNWNSNIHKSCLLYGGTAKYSKWVQHDKDGVLLYANMTVKWPLFTLQRTEEETYEYEEYTGEVDEDGNDITETTVGTYPIGSLLQQPIDPEKCIKAGALYVLEVPKGYHNSFTAASGKSYIVQNKFGSGKRKGEGKTKNVTQPDPSKPKGAQKDHYFTFKGFVKPKNKWKGSLTDAYDNPIWGCGAEVIEELGYMGLPFTDALKRRTSIAKDLGTYYWQEDAKGNRKGMLCLVQEDGIIHHTLNHTSTVTSRMSSKDPNLQNIPRGGTSDVKKMFKSRFGELGKMAEIDYSQLEVVIQGVLSGDPQLCEDLRNRTDFHCKRLAAKLNQDYDHVWKMCHEVEDAEYKAGRTGAKQFSFQRAYGAGISTIAETTGMPKSEVQALADAEEKLYPLVVEFDRNLERSIALNRKPTSYKLYIEGVPFTQGQSHWDSPTGTRYVWREGITPAFMHEKGKYTGFSPTERKNYPMQGFGGEVMQTTLGRVWRYFLENDNFGGNAILVNTVHDCLWIDGMEDVIDEIAPIVQGIMEEVPQVFNAAFPNTLNITVPFPAETEVGRDMFYMEVLKTEH